MLEDQEGCRIRRLLLGGAIFFLVGFIALVILGTVLVAANFNLLEWLE